MVKDATTPPTCLVVLSVEMAEAACRLLRRFIKRRGKGSADTQNEAIIDELLVDAQEVWGRTCLDCVGSAHVCNFGRAK